MAATYTVGSLICYRALIKIEPGYASLNHYAENVFSWLSGGDCSTSRVIVVPKAATPIDTYLLHSLACRCQQPQHEVWAILNSTAVCIV